MSIPSDLLDQLLTGYLDNALSPDERARVESLVESDPQVAADLAELRQLQKSLRSVAQADASIQLDTGFADRVLGAAVDRARSEGLGEDHPLVRLADQPSAPVPSRNQSFPYQYAAVLIGLAASIAIAVLVLRPDQIQGDPSVDRIAKADQSTESVETENTSGVAADAMIASDSTPTVPAIASVQPQARQIETPAEAEIEAGINRDESAVPPTAAVVQAAGPDQSATRANDPAKRTMPATQPSLQTGAILVLEVRLTVAGRMDDAIAAAMQKADLDPADEKELPTDLVGAISNQENDVAVDDDVAILYLQASAKKLDRLYLNLLSDQEGVDSVGMSLAMDTPILKVVDSISPDPTTVRHDSTSLELSGQQSTVSGLVGQLNRLQFAPLNREAAGAMSAASGPDVPSQILLLVR